MQPDERTLQAIKKRALELSKVLTLWAQQEFDISPEYHIKVRVTTSIKHIPIPKVYVDTKGFLYNQAPAPEDWNKVIARIKKLSQKAKPYKRSRWMWHEMVSDLKELRKSDNVAHIRNATRLNIYLHQHGCPCRLVRVDKPDSGVLYSLLSAKHAP